jgi:hypothetical protein
VIQRAVDLAALEKLHYVGRSRNDFFCPVLAESAWVSPLLVKSSTRVRCKSVRTDPEAISRPTRQAFVRGRMVSLFIFYVTASSGTVSVGILPYFLRTPYLGTLPG